MKNERRYPLGVQFTLPDNIENKDFHGKLAHLQSLGFYAVELNVINTKDIPASKLKEVLDSYGLRMTRIATGGMAKARGLSLSHPDAAERRRAQDGLRELMDYASLFGAELILGFLKGGAGQEKEIAQNYLAQSLFELQDKVLAHKTKLVIEATNRYEASAVNSLSDAACVLDKLDKNAFLMLPDTFHMNIEERNAAASLIKYRDYYTAVHISDNNRYFPGLGGIDFASIVSVLDTLCFNGYLGIEGNIYKSFEDDISIAAHMMDDIFFRTNGNFCKTY